MREKPVTSRGLYFMTHSSQIKCTDTDRRFATVKFRSALSPYFRACTLGGHLL